MKIFRKNKAFSLIEISIVILVIGILIFGISSGIDLYQDFRLESANQLTQKSIAGRIDGLTLWFETTSNQSFQKSKPFHNEPIAFWKNLNQQLSQPINVYQNDSQFQPKYILNAINGLPALNFNDGIRYFISDPVLYSEISASDEITIFFVGKSMGTNISNNPHTFFAYSEKNESGSEIFRNQIYLFLNNKILFQFGRLCSSTAPFSDNSCKASVSQSINNHPKRNFITTIVKNKNIVDIYLNKVVSSQNNAHSDVYPNYNSKNSIYLGGNTTRSSLNYFGEIIIYNRSLSTNEIEKIHEYLINKWNIY